MLRSKIFLRLRSPKRKAFQSSKRHGRRPALRVFLFVGNESLQVGVYFHTMPVITSNRRVFYTTSRRTKTG
jgi:hypothetical protein